MDGDIEAAEQLVREAEQCLVSLARKMQLYQSNVDFFQKQETGAEEEERRLLQSIQELKDLEHVYKREAEAAHKKLAEKGLEFQELTVQACDCLSVTALRLETARLRQLTEDLQEENARLSKDLGDGPFPPVDQAAVSSLIAKSRSVQRAYQEVAVEHQRVCAAARTALSEAGAHRAAVQAEEAELEYCRQLKDAIEALTLLTVEAELSAAAAQGTVPTPVGATADTAQAALNRLPLQRDECDSQAAKLAESLEARVTRNRHLAGQLGLLQEEEQAVRLDRSSDYAAPDSTTS